MVVVVGCVSLGRFHGIQGSLDTARVLLFVVICEGGKVKVFLVSWVLSLEFS